jgi:hypothetical protein
MSDRLRISGKDLGAVALPTFCPRCFYIQRHAPQGLPWQIFPGIFSSIDSYSKKVIHSWMDRKGAAPVWLDSIGPIVSYVEPPHYSKFFLIDEETNIHLTGAPDGVFRLADGSHVIVDYKTAKHTKGQDALMPVYHTQLNAYAMIGEVCGLAPVSGLALAYTEPVTDSDTAATDGIHQLEGFAMHFKATIVPVPLDPGQIPPLLRRTREILELPRAPAGRDGCKDCQRLEGIMGLLG